MKIRGHQTCQNYYYEVYCVEYHLSPDGEEYTTTETVVDNLGECLFWDVQEALDKREYLIKNYANKTRTYCVEQKLL